MIFGRAVRIKKSVSIRSIRENQCLMVNSRQEIRYLIYEMAYSVNPASAIRDLEEKAGDRCRKIVGKRAGSDGAEAQAGQIVPAIRRQSSNSADLDADGAEIGKAAQCKGCDHEGAWVQRLLERSELRISNQLVRNQPRAEQVTYLEAVFPGNSHEPCERSREMSEDPLQTELLAAPKRDKPEDGVEERDQSQKRDQHRRYIQSQVQSFARSARGRIDHIDVCPLDLQSNLACSLRLFRFGHNHLGQQNGSRRSHDHRRQQVPRFDSECNVGSHDATRDVSPAARNA